MGGRKVSGKCITGPWGEPAARSFPLDTKKHALNAIARAVQFRRGEARTAIIKKACRVLKTSYGTITPTCTKMRRR